MIYFKLGIIILFLTSVSTVFSQERNFNIIISVDNSLENVYLEKFVINKENGKKDVIRPDYVPGNVTIAKDDYAKLLSEDVINYSLIVKHIEFCKNHSKSISFRIDNFKLSWLTKGNYFVLYIYNTNNKKYKKIYNSLPNKEFTYEYNWSEGAMRRIQKKLTKKQKKCNN